MKQHGEAAVKAVLSEFSCPLSPEVEYFLHKKAIDFAKQGIAQTHLVYTSHKDEAVLAGYFAIANKALTIRGNKHVSKTWLKRIGKFSTYDQALKSYHIAVPLIGQIGKNFANGYDKLITGKILLGMATDKVSQIQMDIGGRYVYLECEDIPKLIDFYSYHQFREFERRKLDPDETDTLSGKYLVQMMKRLP